MPYVCACIADKAPPVWISKPGVPSPAPVPASGFDFAAIMAAERYVSPMLCTAGLLGGFKNYERFNR